MNSKKVYLEKGVLIIMRNKLRLIVAAMLSSAIIVNAAVPVLAQGYQGNYNYNSGTAQAFNQNYNQNFQPVSPLQGRVMIPVGTMMPAAISSPVTSQLARVGDVVTASLGQDMCRQYTCFTGRKPY
ncbi:MAG: hypothetical protein MZU91_05880 [Desulfosudis oleivorans]|nr:hypothetical protein [Desulfosudis oleivorans]